KVEFARLQSVKPGPEIVGAEPCRDAQLLEVLDDDLGGNQPIGPTDDAVEIDSQRLAARERPPTVSAPRQSGRVEHPLGEVRIVPSEVAFFLQDLLRVILGVELG